MSSKRALNWSGAEIYTLLIQPVADSGISNSDFFFLVRTIGGGFRVLATILVTLVSGSTQP
jgi:hypothetical protein